MEFKPNVEVLQYYTVIDDTIECSPSDENQAFMLAQDGEDEDTNQVMYLTFKNQEDEDCIQNDVVNLEHEELLEQQEDDNSAIKFITLQDGQIFVTNSDITSVPSDSVIDVNSQLLTNFVEDDTVPLQEHVQEDSQGSDEVAGVEEQNYRQITLLDGTTAFVGEGMWNSWITQTEQEYLEVEEESDNETANVEQIKKKEKKFKCLYESCGKLYTSAHHLMVHMRNHTGVRPYVCEEKNCNKAFATSYSLKAHSRTHTGEKPYGCKVCNKHFKTSGDLQKHIRTHTGEKPFKCPIEGCSQSFTTSNIRKVHIRSHTGERPYVCKERHCGKAFASATNYKNHTRIHSGEKPYVCSVPGCEKKFTEYSSLYKHNSVHKVGKLFKCSYCGINCKQESTLKTHKRSIHNIIITEDGKEIMIKRDENSESNFIYEISDPDNFQGGEEGKEDVSLQCFQVVS